MLNDELPNLPPNSFGTLAEINWKRCTWYYMSTFISLPKTAMFASYVPRNAFSALHDPSYDVIGQMLGGSGSWNFQGGRKKMGKSYRKNGGIRQVNKRYFRKTAGGLHHPPPPLCRRGLTRARPGAHMCPPPHQFFADSGKTAARNAAKFLIAIHSSFAHLVLKIDPRSY